MQAQCTYNRFIIIIKYHEASECFHHQAFRFISLHTYRYLEKDSDDELEYQQIPGSPGLNATSADDDISGEEEDPLDAFMAGVDKQVSQFLNYFSRFVLFAVKNPSI